MKAHYANGTLDIYLDKTASEHIDFGSKITKLSADLKEPIRGKDLGKLVELIFNKSQEKRLGVAWLPEDSIWDDLQTIQVYVNPSLAADLEIYSKIVEEYENGFVIFKAVDDVEKLK